MRKIILTAGKSFGKWTVLEDATSSSPSQSGQYRCECECGTIRIVSSYSLRKGLSLSCGCDMIGNTQHGLCYHPLFRVWGGMKDRCYYEGCCSFKYYGARGITVCDEWKNDFKAFYDWAIGNGYIKGLTIERKNRHGNYEPSNCCWATMKVQNRNCSRNHLVTYQGRTMPLVSWCDELHLSYSVVNQRLTKLNWTPKEAFQTPVRKMRIAKRTDVT